MADSLFDNRYRYDYIYPRGRSGETLRAVDTQDNNRLVVIKRPAPNDAPPIRAGQEVSILNERKALMRLAGHPAATALLGGGYAGYNLYETRDGWIALAALEPHFARRVAGVLGLDELSRDALRSAFAREASSHWLRVAEQHDLPLVALSSS